MLAEALLTALISTCAHDVGYSTMRALVQVESGGNPWIINSNTLKRSFRFDSQAAAESAASNMLRAGHNIDMGLGQVNSRNMQGLGLTVNRAFEPCSNLQASASILKSSYFAAKALHGAKGEAMVLRHALSRYNTGNDWNGLRNGYVAKVEAAALGKPTAMSSARQQGAPAQQNFARQDSYISPARSPAVVWIRPQPGPNQGFGVQTISTNFVLN